MKIKNGFLTYVFIFLGLVVGTFLVLVAVMLLRPGTSIFGLQWANKNEYALYTSVEHFEDFDKYDIITINSISKNADGKTNENGYYDIIFRAGTDDAVNSNIKIENKVTGLIKSSEAESFKVEIVKDVVDEQKRLTINVYQLNTWIAFSDQCTITVNIPYNISLSNTKLEANTASGFVNFGGQKGDDATPTELNASFFEAKTQNGNISVQSFANANRYDFTTTKGSIYVNRNISTILTKFKTTSGNISAKEIISSRVELSSDSGTIETDDIKIYPSLNPFLETEDKLVSIDTKRSVVRIDDIVGNVVFTEQTESPNVKIGKVEGDLGLIYGNNVKLSAENITGFTDIKIEKGDISIGNKDDSTLYGLAGRTNIELKSGSLHAIITDDNDEVVNINAKNARVNLNIEKINNTVTIETEKGDVDLTLQQTVSTNLVSKTQATLKYVWKDISFKGADHVEEIRGTDPYVEGKDISVTSINGDIIVNRISELVWD